MECIESCINCAYSIGCYDLELDRLTAYKACNNPESEHYNEIFSEDEAKQRCFECFTSQMAYDYRYMTPFDFVKKYYK